MFITDNLVYIQLQKTGCTHIARLLRKVVGGEQIGKHNSATPELLQSPRIFVSSIRNPWEWYLSLWSYGCDGKGGIRRQLTSSGLRGRVSDEKPLSIARRAYRELSKDTAEWRRLYADSNDPELFREWLKTILDYKSRFDFGEGFGESDISKFSGLYTYRFLTLCCRNTSSLSDGSILCHSDLSRFTSKNCYVSEWIRNENLENDVIRILEVSGKVMSKADEDVVRSQPKTNISSRAKSIEPYFDDESRELIRSKERLIIEKFDYSISISD